MRWRDDRAVGLARAHTYDDSSPAGPASQTYLPTHHIWKVGRRTMGCAAFPEGPSRRRPCLIFDPGVKLIFLDMTPFLEAGCGFEVSARAEAIFRPAGGRFTSRLLVSGTIPHHHVGSSSFKLRWTRLAMRFQKSIGSLGWFYSSVELLGAERFSDL